MCAHGHVLALVAPQVLPGCRVPVDGIVVDGVTYLNEAMVTGESEPVHKAQGTAAHRLQQCALPAMAGRMVILLAVGA